MNRIERINKPLFKGWQRALLFIIPFLVAIVLSSIVSYFFTEFVFNNQHIEFNSFLNKFFDSIFVTLMLLFFVRFIDKVPFISLGFSTRNRIKDIIFGILAGFLVMLIAFYILLYCNEIRLLKYTIEFKDIFLAILIYALVGYVEEVVFRGYILYNLMFSCTKFWALFWSSLLFALLHGANPNMDWFSFLSLFLAGYFLGITYVFTKNLWFPIALHFSWNFFQSMFGFNVSGQDFYSIINFKILNPNKFNGGAFGLEGSYLSTIVEILFIGFVVFYYNKIKKKENFNS